MTLIRKSLFISVLINCLLFFTLHVSGQSDTLKFKQYYMLAKQHLNIDLDSSTFYINKARLSISEKEFPAYFIDCGLLESLISNRKGNEERSLKILENSLSIAENADVLPQKAKVLMFLGIHYKNNRQFDQAEIYYKKALEVSEGIPDSSLIGSILYSLATIYEMNNQLEKALKTFQQTMDIERELGLEKNMAGTLMNMSFIYEKLNNFEQAEKNIRNAIILNNKFNDQNGNIIAYINLSTLLMEQDKFEKAVQSLTKADSLMTVLKFDNELYFHNVYGNLAESYYNLKQYSNAITYASKIIKGKPDINIKTTALRILAKANAKQGNCAATYEHLNKIDSNVSDELLPDELVKHYHILAEIYQICKNYKEAYQNLNLAYDLKDSVYIETDKQNAIEAEAKYQASVKERENEKLKFDNNLQLAQIQTQNAYIWGGSLSLLILGLMLVFLYRLNQKRKTLNLALAESNKRTTLLHRESLHRNQNQLALATTLISLQKSQAANKDPMEIIKDSESKLRAIAAVNKKLAIQDEEQIAKLSEVIEEIVAGNIFSMAPNKIELQAEIEDIPLTPERVSVLSLLTNELSVNSIKHAFGNTTDPKIYINFHQKNGSYVYSYRDNGQVAEVQKEGSGTQLINGLINQLNGRHSVEMKPSYQLRVEIPVV